MRIEYNTIEDITTAIKHLMIDNNLRQKDICNATGLSKQSVSNILNNQSRNITLDTLNRLCKAVNCTLYIDMQNNTDTES